MMHLMIAGNVGRDGEVRTTQSGKVNCSWSVACDTGFGENKTTTWVRCTMWGERGEKISGYIKKGTKVVVTGEPNLNVYTAKDGTTKSSLELRVSEVKLMGGGEDQSNSYDQSPLSGGGETPPLAGDLDDDIPFITPWPVGNIG